MRLPPILRLPKGALTILREVARHLLRRPVVGIAAVAQAEDGRYVLIRRADTGTWALPGGTLDWGETLAEAIVRELREEAGVETTAVGPLLGVFSKADRDPRFHAVTVLVRCRVQPPHRAPVNPLEITEVGLFHKSELPPLAMSMSEMIALADGAASPYFE